MSNKYVKKFSNILSNKGNVNKNNKILSHPSQNGSHPESKQQMLVRMQRKRTFYTLSVRRQISSVTIEINMSAPQETKSRTII
jgi:hypothetical protein